MGSSWFVRPDTAVLQLPHGRTLTVRRRLSMGDERRFFHRISTSSNERGELQFDRREFNLAQVLAYLIDWNASDDDGRPVPIRGLSTDDLQQVLENLRPDIWSDIRAAIADHDLAMGRERDAEKNGQTGETTSAATSPSPSAAAGASNGSANLTAMTTPF